MKKTFPGYYRPNEEEFSDLWKNCIFILDANVILNLYRYSKETSDEFIDILKHISDRLWVPHQAALEYQKKRLEVISQQLDVYDEIINIIKKFKEQITITLSRHPYLDPEIILKKMKRGFRLAEKYIEDAKQEHPDLLHDDVLRETISTLFSGNVGSPYSEERVNEIYKIGEKRYKNEIPPGYKDNSKDNDLRKYGDLILWFQLIDKAIESKKPIILITDDSKEDWLYKFKRRTIGPRPELIEEVRSKAGVMFYLYQADPFMENAKNYLQKQVKQEAINEVREVRKRDEDVYKTIQELSVPSGQLFNNILSAMQAAGTLQPLHNAINAMQVVGTQPLLSAMQAAGTIQPFQNALSAVREFEEALKANINYKNEFMRYMQSTSSIFQNLQPKSNNIEDNKTITDYLPEEKNEEDEEE